ncbi:MAG: putative ABC transporter permease [Roseburia faecis]
MPSFCIGTKPLPTAASSTGRGFRSTASAQCFSICCWAAGEKIHPAGVFFLSAAIGTGLELLIGWFLDAFWNLRYWDYSGYPFHFHGYICLYAAVGFGIAGVLWICVLEAPLTRLWKRLSPKVRLGLNTLLLLLFAADCAAALIFPNRGAGITFP